MSIFARIGTIKGESRDARHKDEIDVLSWSWESPSPAPRGREGEAARARRVSRTSKLHPSRGQGVAASHEGVRHG